MSCPLLDHVWGISPGADRVWAQIAGIAPSTKPWQRLFMILQAQPTVRSRCRKYLWFHKAALFYEEMKASGHQWAWLHLTPRLDAHFSQIVFAETGFRIKIGGPASY